MAQLFVMAKDRGRPECPSAEGRASDRTVLCWNLELSERTGQLHMGKRGRSFKPPVGTTRFRAKQAITCVGKKPCVHARALVYASISPGGERKVPVTGVLGGGAGGELGRPARREPPG